MAGILPALTALGGMGGGMPGMSGMNLASLTGSDQNQPEDLVNEGGINTISKTPTAPGKDQSQVPQGGGTTPPTPFHAHGDGAPGGGAPGGAAPGGEDQQPGGAQGSEGQQPGQEGDDQGQQQNSIFDMLRQLGLIPPGSGLGGGFGPGTGGGFGGGFGFGGHERFGGPHLGHHMAGLGHGMGHGGMGHGGMGGMGGHGGGMGRGR